MPIAATTTALSNLLQAVTHSLPDTNITTKPPSKARQDHSGSNQLNLYLYQTAVNTSWRSATGSSPSGDQDDDPPLALNLYYLISAYGEGDNELNSHQLLSAAMRIMQQHPALHIGNVGEVRIALHPLNLEEMSRLWSIFQTPYALSVAYQVSAVPFTD